MAHFAQLDDTNLVLQVIVVSNADLLDESGNEVEALGIAVCEAAVGPGPWVQTSYNNNFRGKYAAIGDTYHSDIDRFVGPQPYPSWVLTDSGAWIAPVPMPDDGTEYEWNEQIESWAHMSPTVSPSE